ncbi:hypothetical protein AOLI_G00274950 [Acnodon oligacanthus]
MPDRDGTASWEFNVRPKPHGNTGNVRLCIKKRYGNRMFTLTMASFRYGKRGRVHRFLPAALSSSSARDFARVSSLALSSGASIAAQS